MVYSDINHLSSNLGSLRLDASANMENETVSSADDNPNVAQQDNQNAAIVMSPEEALVKLSEKTKYPIMQENGQRRYGPPPDWIGKTPQRGCEVFIGKIPRDCFEDELVPIFENMGRIFMFRLMMDFSGCNRGYGFCIYTNREDTKRAVQELDNYEIRKGKMLGVCLSVDNCRLFVGGIPKTKTKEEILVEMMKVTEGVKDVIVYPSAADKTLNRGFAFVEYDNHKAAAMARRKLIPGRIQLWGHQIAVDWAEPEREVDEDVMSKVKILYVRNLMLTTSEETIREAFDTAGGGDAVERVKKIRDYAFVHFKERDQAGRSLLALDDTELENSRIEVTWAKPVEKPEYVRYTRATSTPTGGGTKLPGQIQMTGPGLSPPTQIVYDPYLGNFTMYGAPTAQLTAPPPGTIITSDTRLMGMEESDNESDASNMMRRNGRPYRNAAGSRSAGTRGAIPGYTVRDNKKHPVEILDEMCQKNNWGTPSYTTSVSEVIDPNTGGKVQFYIGQVTLPNLCRQFQGPRAYMTPEESKTGAAEYVIQMIQFGAQSIDNQARATPQPPATMMSHQLAYPQSQSIISQSAYPTYATYSYGLPATSQAPGLSAGLSLMAAPDASQVAQLVYDPSALMAQPPQPTFINPMAFSGAELYSHY